MSHDFASGGGWRQRALYCSPLDQQIQIQAQNHVNTMHIGGYLSPVFVSVLVSDSALDQWLSGAQRGARGGAVMHTRVGLRRPASHQNCPLYLCPYLIFVIFFTLANFEAWKFYT